MKENKYELTDEVIEHNGHTLHRIKALKDFGSVSKGDLGGFIESESNLSQEQLCWIFENAKVYEVARICGNAYIYGSAVVRDAAQVFGHAEISDNVKLRGFAKVYDYAAIHDDVTIYQDAEVCDNAQVFDSVKIFGNAEVCGDIKIGGAAVIQEMGDYMVFKNNWSSGRYFTWTKSNDMWNVGCFYGTGEELIEKAYKDSEKSGKNYENYVKFVKQYYKK